MAAYPMNYLFTLTLCIVLMVGTVGEVCAQDAERAKNLIVVISGDLSGDNDVFGAGIIVGEQNDYLYLATANHVVRRGPKEATNLKVAFHFMPGMVEATLMDDADEDLDLAMLRVDLGRDRVPLDEVPFEVLGDPSALQQLDGLYGIGHPEGNRWFANLETYPFDQHDGYDLIFQTSSIGEGHSGGGLFDAQWKLVGLITRTSGQSAFATSIDRIQEKLADWRYPINLSRSEAPGGEIQNTETASGAPVGDIRNTKIAFQSARDGNLEIYVMDIDGANARRLTNNTARDYDPSWSPDGRQIAFYSNRDGNAEIYVMDIDGTTERRLTFNRADDTSPAWSPDGAQIAFQSNRDGNDEIYLMAADGTNLRRLTNNTARDYAPAWSPDGRQIAFNSDRDGNDEIYVMVADGTNERRLTNNTTRDDDPAWSPDGTQIAFRSNRDGNDEIYVMAADGTNLRRLTNNTATDVTPAWSPDGKQIVFWSLRDRYRNIYVIDADGTNERQLTNNTSGNMAPSWSPFFQ